MIEDLTPAVLVEGPALPARRLPWRAFAVFAAVVTLLAMLALLLAWRADDRVRSSERDLVKRQQDSARVSSESDLLARQAQESARDTAAKVALLEARLNEVAVQRGQL